MSLRSDIHLSPRIKIGDNHPCLIVAEIGQNHQGDINIAEQLISITKECGADVVKFQMSCLDEKFTKSALAREYTGPNSWGKTYGEHKLHLEFTKEQYMRLKNYAFNKDILFTASAMDMVSLDFLNSLDPPFIKIGSGDNTNFLLLDKALNLKKPLVISTGMLDMVGVIKLYDRCKGRCQAALLHCVSAYPATPSSINLNVIDSYRDRFRDMHIGYSGHEKGTAISIAAVAKGAKILERHVTLNKKWKGTDHACSLEPTELSALVVAVRDIESALGTGEKKFLECELACYNKLGKSIVAGKDIKAGSKLNKNMIKIKVSQPSGLMPSRLPEILNKTIKNNMEEDQAITEEDLR